MKLRINDKWVKVLKFEAKLLLGVAIGSLILIWVLNTAIYTAGEYVANAYVSDQPLFK